MILNIICRHCVVLRSNPGVLTTTRMLTVHYGIASSQSLLAMSVSRRWDRIFHRNCKKDGSRSTVYAGRRGIQTT